MRLKFLLSLAVLLILSACGREEAPDQTSNFDSLTGYPCQAYNKNLGDEKYYCARFKDTFVTSDVLFEINGFNSAQIARVKESLALAVQRYSAHFLKPATPMSPLVKCTLKYASKDFLGTGGFSAIYPTNEGKIIWALSSIQFHIQYHVDHLKPIVIKGISVEPVDEIYTIGEARLGNDLKKVKTDHYDVANLDISLNKVAIDNPTFSTDTFAGTIVHEWLHRTGWEHPNGYEGSMIKELGLCVSRNNADKSLFLVNTEPKFKDNVLRR